MKEILYLLEKKPITGASASILGWVISIIPSKEILFNFIQGISLCIGLLIGVITLFFQIIKSLTKPDKVTREAFCDFPQEKNAQHMRNNTTFLETKTFFI
jgi:hypothetical protein